MITLIQDMKSYRCALYENQVNAISHIGPSLFEHPIIIIKVNEEAIHVTGLYTKHCYELSELHGTYEILSVGAI